MNRPIGNLGASLREARVRRGISADTFADQLGITLKRLADIEAGESRASVDILLGAVLTFDIQPDELFGAEQQDRDIARLMVNLPLLRDLYRTVRSK